MCHFLFLKRGLETCLNYKEILLDTKYRITLMQHQQTIDIIDTK